MAFSLFLISATTSPLAANERPIFTTDEGADQWILGGHGFYKPKTVVIDSTVVTGQVPFICDWFSVSPDSRGECVLEYRAATGGAQRVIVYPGMTVACPGAKTLEVVGVGVTSEVSLRVFAGMGKCPVIYSRGDSVSAPLSVRECSGLSSKEDSVIQICHQFQTAAQATTRVNTVTLIPPGYRFTGGFMSAPSLSSFLIELWACAASATVPTAINLGAAASSTAPGSKCLASIQGANVTQANVTLPILGADFGATQLYTVIRGVSGSTSGANQFLNLTLNLQVR